MIQRCLFVYSSGEQCQQPAEEGLEFCEEHIPAPVEDEPVELPLSFRILRRSFAALMLGLFLLQLYVGLRLLYGW